MGKKYNLNVTNLLERLETPFPKSFGHFHNRLDVISLDRRADFRSQKRRNVIGLVGHDLRENHILEGTDGVGLISSQLKSFQSLVAIGIRRLEILLIGRIQNTRLKIYGSLKNHVTI